MGNVHFLKTRRSSLAEDTAAAIIVTPHGFSLGPDFLAWQSVAEIRAWKCNEAFLGFTVGARCIAVSEARTGFDALEAAVIAAFPSTATWREARDETVLFRRSK